MQHICNSMQLCNIYIVHVFALAFKICGIFNGQFIWYDFVC